MSTYGETEADVLIVGSGPAGAMAARTIARAGLRAILLDRAEFPRDKPCGGGISRRLLLRFPEIAKHITETVPVNYIHTVHLESPSGHPVEIRSPTPMFLMIQRYDFDSALFQLAQAAGVITAQGASVSRVVVSDEQVRVICADGRLFSSKLVIGADGVTSVVAREAGLNRKWGLDQLAVVTVEKLPRESFAAHDPGTMYITYGDKKVTGYGYVFPKVHQFDVGVGFLLSDHLQQPGQHPYKRHRRFIEKLTELSIFSGHSDKQNIRPYFLPIWGPLPKTYGNRILLCGDAGGFVNSATGEGIYYAMISGQCAGETAVEAIRAGKLSEYSLAKYQVRWQKEIGTELEASVTVGRQLLNPDYVDSLARLAVNSDQFKRIMVSTITGEDSRAD